MSHSRVFEVNFLFSIGVLQKKVPKFSNSGRFGGVGPVVAEQPKSQSLSLSGGVALKA